MAGTFGAADAFGGLPLSFEPNVGQTAAQVDYLTRTSGYTLYLSGGTATLDFAAGSGMDRLAIAMRPQRW